MVEILSGDDVAMYCVMYDIGRRLSILAACCSWCLVVVTELFNAEYSISSALGG